MFFCKKIITIFDSDKTGKEAAERASRRKNVDVLDLGYKDPDECLKKLGLSRFKSYIEKKITDIPPF